MEQIKILWIVFFFLFSLTLLFTWSKVYIISRKVKNVAALLSQIESLDEKKGAEEALEKKKQDL
jgi:hypothetical protein